MEFDFEQLRELLTVFGQTDISELTLKSNDFELTVRRDVPTGASSIVAGGTVVDTGLGTPVVTVPQTIALQPTPTPDVAPPPPSPAPLANERLLEITSPMVGTFYRSPAPDEAPFVEVGDRVRSGQTVCIIEAMKLMNELESEVVGEIVEILVDNGQPVEYGQTLMRVKPA